MGIAAPPLSVTDEQRRVLTAWERAQSTPQAVAARVRVILYAAEGMANSQIADAVGVTRTTVIAARKRFEVGGPGALAKIAKGRGRRTSITAEQVAQIIHDTLQTKPRAATHWSCRTMAKAHGISAATVQRIWDANGLQPHRIRTFKLSTDQRFVEKLVDVVGLYMNPPDKAIVLCVDEKSQIQALDRTQPGLPMKKGRAGTVTHDYKRNGTTTLFAALNILDGTVVGECLPRHRHQEFLKFLRKLDREFPEGIDLHLIVDNYGTHSHPNVTKWLTKHQRFHLHFTPTSSSWLNLVEPWFRNLTDQRIRRGVFHSVPDLVAAIDDYLAANNDDPNPFIWTASVAKILAKIEKCRAIYETLH